jgi:hypothetical protein
VSARLGSGTENEVESKSRSQLAKRLQVADALDAQRHCTYVGTTQADW